MSSSGPPEPSDTPKPGPHPPGRRKARKVNPLDQLRASLQYLLDCEGDGWQLAHYVVVMGLQKVKPDGSIGNAAWLAAPTDQPDYVTDGLISCAGDMRANCEVDDD